MDRRALAAMGVLLASIVLASVLDVRDGGDEGWAVAHVESMPIVDGGEQGYLEEWVLIGVDGHAPTDPASYRLRIAGDEADLRWEGPPGRCAVFRHWWPEVDHLEPVALEVEGRVVWKGLFGSGSGTPLPRACV